MEQDLSEEDKLLQDELNMLVDRLTQRHYSRELERLQALITASAKSITSVPKPLKFLRAHYNTLKEVYDKIKNAATKRFCADIVSIVSMAVNEGKDCLKYRILGSKVRIHSWGHEYVRHLASQIVQEWQESKERKKTFKDRLLAVAKEIVAYQMSHNAESEACDLLMEIERLELLPHYVKKAAYDKVCLYLMSCAQYVSDEENAALLKCVMNLYWKFQEFPQALKFALALNDRSSINEIFFQCLDPLLKKQLALMLARYQIPANALSDLRQTETYSKEKADLRDIVSNVQLNQHFIAVAKELAIMDPKVPEDVYKTYLESTHHRRNTESASQNLAAAFVNGFINAAFGTDKLITVEDGHKWVYKNKELGLLSATASLGLILLWDVGQGLTQMDKFFYAKEDYIRAGALLACGIVSTGVHYEAEPAQALLCDYVKDSNPYMRIGAINGLGVAYAGTNKEDVLSLILQVLGDSTINMEVIGNAALACGMIAVGTCNGEVTSTILQTMMERSETELKETYSRYLALGLALTVLGRQDSVDTVTMALHVVAEPLRSMATMLVDVCAFAGTGNVLKIQQLLHICSEYHISNKKPNGPDLPTQQGVAVLGIGLIAMGEEIGCDMAFRVIGQLLQYGDIHIRRACPLSLALISASNPKFNMQDTLSKFSHDLDHEVAQNAILAMGIVGAGLTDIVIIHANTGTNNARLAAMLRQLAVYHAQSYKTLFIVRVAQGLTHLGKGTLTLSPYHSNHTLMSPVAVAGILSVLVSCLDIKNTIAGKQHYLLYNMVTAIQPRILMTFDEHLQPLPTAVRIGQAVDAVGQAGTPKTITGFQTHSTPVVMAHGERAELETDEYIPLAPILEGFVILQKNPNFIAEF